MSGFWSRVSGAAPGNPWSELGCPMIADTSELPGIVRGSRWGSIFQDLEPALPLNPDAKRIPQVKGFARQTCVLSGICLAWKERWPPGIAQFIENKRTRVFFSAWSESASQRDLVCSGAIWPVSGSSTCRMNTLSIGQAALNSLPVSCPLETKKGLQAVLVAYRKNRTMRRCSVAITITAQKTEAGYR